jgi:hypothetical protein
MYKLFKHEARLMMQKVTPENVELNLVNFFRSVKSRLSDDSARENQLILSFMPPPGVSHIEDKKKKKLVNPVDPANSKN